MTAMTSYLQKKLLDHLFGFAVFTPPTEIFLSLHTEVLDDAGSHVDEVSTVGTGYGRLSLNALMTDTDLATGIAMNDVTITIGPATTDWGIIVGVGFDDAATGGNMLLHHTPPVAKLVLSGQSFGIAIQQLQIRFD